MADERFEMKFEVDATDVITLGDTFQKSENAARKLESTVDSLSGTFDSMFGDASKASQGLDKLYKSLQQTANSKTTKQYTELAESLERINKLTNQVKYTGRNATTGGARLNSQIGLDAEVENYNRLVQVAKLSDAQIAKSKTEQVSASVDFAIAKQKEESRVFSEGLKSRLTEETRVAQESEKLQQQYLNQLPRLRYALYDISNATGRLGQSLLNGVVKPLSTAIDMQRQFADVIRTVGGNAGALRKEFDDLFTSIPMSWSELTDIGTLAGQLNIASQDVAEFTRLVAMFGTTTDVSIEQSAIAFGRLSELLDVSGEDYERLGSSILRVGINSVATESQIIAISTQISAMGNLAGLTADEVFGLSAAMASLGIQPELARGTITRLFSNILNAVAESGEKLEDFARISRMTSSEFAQLWESDASGALVALLRGVQTEGDGATRALQGLGIASVRDVPALLRLAQNLDMVEDSLYQAKIGWEDGTELQGQYGIIAETVASKLQVLQNTFQKLLATVGEAGLAFGWVIDGLTGLVKGIDALISNPIGQFIVSATLALMGFVAVMSLAVSAITRGVATMAAIPTIMNQINVSTKIATVAVNGFKIALISTGIGALILGLGSLISMFTSAGDSAGYFTTNQEALNEALTRDNEELAKRAILASRTSDATSDVSDETKDWADKLAEAFARQRDLNNAVDETTNALKAQGAVMGENTKKIVAEAIASNEALKEFFTGSNSESIIPAMEDLGFDQAEFFRQIGESNGEAYLQSFLDTLDTSGIDLGIDESMKYAVEYLVQELMPQIASMDASLSQSLLDAHWKSFSSAILSDAPEMEEAIARLGDAMDDAFGESNLIRELGSDLEDFFNVLAEGGADAAGVSPQIQSAIESIYDMDPSNAANNLQAFYDFLITGAGMSADSLITLSSVIASLGGATGSATINFGAFSNSLGKVGRSASGASRQVRTLLDYANDLSQVWSRAFNIRFDRRSALDDIISGWREINERIDEYRRKLMELTADRSIKQYWLQVAEAFGDNLRADALRAEIENLNKEIADAQAGASTSLTGNSKGAIENRKTIMGMVSSYQDYTKALVESGASQSTIQNTIRQSKADFYAQGQAMGFSRAELDLYAKSFDDMSKAVERVPKNITVKANTDPALQALNEFQAQASKSGGSAGKAYGDAYSRAMRDAMIAGEVSALQTRINAIRSSMRPGDGPAPLQLINQLNQQIKSLRGYRSGGYTGNGGVNQIAGAVHGREYVIPAHGVNQSTKLPDMSYVASLQRGKSAPQLGYQGGGYVGNNAGMPVELGPSTMRVLVDGLNKQGYVLTTPEQIAGLANTGNRSLTRMGQKA